MPPTITIRPATVTDVDQLHALMVALAEHHGQRAWLRATVDDLRRDGFGPTPSFAAILAFAGDEAVGYASYTTPYAIWLGTSYLHLDDVYVADAARGQGVGGLLMREIVAIAAARGLCALRWEVEPDNAGAIAFYRRLGATMRTKGIFTWEVEAAVRTTGCGAPR